MNRMRPVRWLAARRAAKRRCFEQALIDARAPLPEPLPPLVSPGDDREFLDPPRPPVPVAHEAAGAVATVVVGA
jgi:hypothetical protein